MLATKLGKKEKKPIKNKVNLVASLEHIIPKREMKLIFVVKSHFNILE